MVTWLLMHEHALSHIMLYDDSRITMRDAQVHVALEVQQSSGATWAPAVSFKPFLDL